MVAGFANRFRVGLTVINSFKRVEPKPLGEHGTDFGSPKVVFHVEFDSVNLIEETLLQASVFEHLAIGSGFFFVDDSLN